MLAGIRRTHGRPPAQKEALLPEHLLAMLDALPPSDLRNLRDRAILLIGFAGGLRRSEIVGLDCGAEDSSTGAGWPEFFDGGLLLTLRGKTGWREVEIGRGSRDATCPVAALETWLKFARIARGPLFRRVRRAQGRRRAAQRPSCRAPGQARRGRRRRARRSLRGASARRKFSGHSLRAGLASSAEVDERYVQKQLGHASRGNDPPLPAPPRPVPRQSHQGGGAVIAGIGLHCRAPLLDANAKAKWNARLLAKRFNLKS